MSENVWTKTTRKHLNWLESGKKKRIQYSEFRKLFSKAINFVDIDEINCAICKNILHNPSNVSHLPRQFQICCSCLNKIENFSIEGFNFNDIVKRIDTIHKNIGNNIRSMQNSKHTSLLENEIIKNFFNRLDNVKKEVIHDFIPFFPKI